MNCAFNNDVFYDIKLIILIMFLEILLPSCYYKLKSDNEINFYLFKEFRYKIYQRYNEERYFDFEHVPQHIKCYCNFLLIELIYWTYYMIFST